MVLIFGDLIADLSVRISEFPVKAQDLKPISYLEIGPGGATNIAIMAARFGLTVGCMGEVGRDSFGELVLRGLTREGIDTKNVIVTDESKTPVAGVLVDKNREPAYLGYPGNLTVHQFAEVWRNPVETAEALFADGWVEIPQMPQMILDAFQTARDAGVPRFFDPGPGNPALDLEWHVRAAALSTVLLVNEPEAQRLADVTDAFQAARKLLRNGAELVVLKRGADGLALLTKDAEQAIGGFKVEPRDFTGAGDSVTGSVLYSRLNGLDLKQMGTLANATGATKVQKLGTGHNMPTPEEIRGTLRKHASDYANLL